jgi:hypothetical protein
MAFTIQSVFPQTYDPNLDFKSETELIKLALDGNIGAAGRVTRDGADFQIQCRTTAAETGPAIELLTARLVPFPANFQRVVEVEAYVTGDNVNERGWLLHKTLVTGAATPVVQTTTLTASTPAQLPGNVLSAAAGGGLAAGVGVTVVAGAGTLTVNVVSAEAEILNWVVKVRVGKLVPFFAGV